MRVHRMVVLWVCLLYPLTAMAESLFRGSTFVGHRSALVQVTPDQTAPAPIANAPSLFIGQTEGGFFEPYPVRVAAFPPPTGVVQSAAAPMGTLGGTPVARLRHLIAQAEAGRSGYDAVQHGATVRPAKKPTQMTIAEIYKWIDDTPRQPHAIGRYQFIPPTLKRLVIASGIPTSAQFTPDVQDALADILLVEAGYRKFLNGTITRTQFMHGLAKIWAGLPLPNGKSYYQGYAGNKATITWAYFNGEMAKIFDG